MKHFHFLLHHWKLLFVGIIVALCASFLEGMGVTFIIPLLGDVQMTDTSNISFPFNKLLGAFSGIGLVVRLRIVAGLLVSVILAKGFFMYGTMLVNSRLQIITVKHFRMLCLDQLMKVGMSYFNTRRSGNLHTVCTIYCQELGGFISQVWMILPNLFNIFIYLIIAMLLSWQAALISIVFAALASLILRRIQTNAANIGRAYTAAINQFNSIILELIMSMKVVRLFNRERETVDLCENSVDRYNHSLFRTVRIRGLVQPVFEITGTICLAIIMVIGSIFLIGSNKIGISGLIVFIVIFHRISRATTSINQYRVAIAGDLPKYMEVFNFLDSKDKQCLKNGSIHFKQLAKGIELRGVAFGYNPQESDVLKDISLYLPKGAKFGVVGVSGAGKSTLTELLLRFYDPQKGQIFVDEIELKEIEVGSWRRKIGVVSQDVFLFNDTVRANIAYAKPEATQEQIESVARKAHAHEFIQELPQGYDTIVGERGVLLSGGQKQRIAIARAIIINPEILIFDEATSSLDTVSEKIVQEALDEVGQDRTVITIAHRLSTIFGSDKIIVIDSGKIVEEGTHRELMQKNGFYNKLVKMQESEEQKV